MSLVMFAGLLAKFLPLTPARINTKSLYPGPGSTRGPWADLWSPNTHILFLVTNEAGVWGPELGL